MTTWANNIDTFEKYEVVRTFKDGRPSDLIAVFESELMAFDYADYLNTIGIPAFVAPCLFTWPT